jgi:hypothetical protein
MNKCFLLDEDMDFIGKTDSGGAKYEKSHKVIIDLNENTAFAGLYCNWENDSEGHLKDETLRCSLHTEHSNESSSDLGDLENKWDAYVKKLMSE